MRSQQVRDQVTPPGGMRQDTRSNYITYITEQGELNTDIAMLGQGVGEAESLAGNQQMLSTPTSEETSAQVQNSDTQQGLPGEAVTEGFPSLGTARQDQEDKSSLILRHSARVSFLTMCMSYSVKRT